MAQQNADRKPDLHPFFHPQTVAVVGASASPGKVGHTVLTNMIGAGFKGRLIPVNPKGGEIEGLPVAATIAELPRGLDLAVVAVPRRFVVDSLRELGALGARSAIVITAGFKEVGKEGWYLEQEIREVCAEHGMALLGPNCLGMINASAGVNASFAAGQPNPGSIAFFSQSGALCVAILDWAVGANIGFSKFVSLGNKALLDEADMLEYLAQDTETKVILGYIENVEHGEAFLRSAEAVCRQKPVLMIKSGTTAAGAKAASSHTGAIAGSDQAYEAAFRKCGIIRVQDVETLFNLAQAFSAQPLPHGPNLAIVTNAGGPGILAADDCARFGLNMARPEQRTVERLQAFLPPYAGFYNPFDIIGDADAARFRKALEIVIDDPMTHSLLVILTPTPQADVEATARAVVEVGRRRTDKPVFCCFMGMKGVHAGKRILDSAGVPCFEFPEPAVQSIKAMYDHFLRSRRGLPEPFSMERDRERAARVVAEARAKGTLEIVEFQAQEFLAAYGLPTPPTKLARSSDEAVAAAEAMGWPVVLKIASPDISHKSDVGGVAVNVRNAEEVRRTFWDITSRAAKLRPEAYVVGCLVQRMAPPGVKEVIVGFKRDEQFGPLIMFGLGGIYVEVLKDIAFRLAPLSARDAFEIVREIKSYMLLKGVRGEQPVNFEALERIILTISQVAVDFPEILEAEFNPVLVDHDTAIVADVRMTLHS
ncbi:acetate--CoA ligase family protein [Paucidesulfovibrio longus]|uniref:acetate--CoA ligase family protein n=1 Tax=Paucidesulfovibrio longus TaxID=889 RepID=UPI0003B7B89F|nr:acetate--CoA ligase [Paucidesulfovibrio longus]